MITHRLQPTPRTCGQTVCAMLADVDPAEVIRTMGKRGATRGVDLVRWLRARGFTIADRPVRFVDYSLAKTTDLKARLPAAAIVRIDWGTDRKRTHWILWVDGRFYDPDNADGFLWAHRGGRIYSFIPFTAPRPT